MARKCSRPLGEFWKLGCHHPDSKQVGAELMFLLWIGFGFVLGLLVALIFIWRHEQAKQNDPWITPPTQEAARLIASARIHLYCNILGRPESYQGEPEVTSLGATDAIRALCIRDGVIFFEKGFATLPDGRRVDLGATATEWPHHNAGSTSMSLALLA